MMLYFIVWFVTSHENISYYITSYTTNNTLHYTTPLNITSYHIRRMAARDSDPNMGAVVR